MYYKILTGTAKEVEKELNNLRTDDNYIKIEGMSTTNETTTIILQVTDNYFFIAK